ncbi:MAG: SDR family oxidoreductase [Kiloniellales bacterium]
MLTHPSLAGKRVLVTAGARGIGRAIAAGFLANGARVHICEVDAEALAAAKEALPDLGGTLTDVSKPEDVERLFDEAEARLGGLDALVNNAGIAGPTGPIESLEHADWLRTLDVNLNGMFLCLKRAVPLLRQAGGGSIVNLASTAGTFGYPLRTPYAASKWAVVGLTKSLAMELGPDRIRVNAICPGSVEGERIERVIAAEAKARGVSKAAVRESYTRGVSLKTFVTAEEIADMVLFVCCDLGAKVSGQALAVDGNTETLAS